MYTWNSLPEYERQLMASDYKLFYNGTDEQIVEKQVCPECNNGLFYIGYKKDDTYKPLMYCRACPYWAEFQQLT